MKVIDQSIIYSAADESPIKRYACFPSLTILADSSILCSFKVGHAKLSTTDNILMARSTDGGKTWKTQFAGFDTTYEGVPGSVHSCHVTALGPDNLIASCGWIDRSSPDLPYANPDTAGILPTKCLLAWSHDNGRTWGRFRQVKLRHHDAAVPSGKIAILNNGSLALPYENWKRWNDVDGNYSSAIVLSRDQGKSWSWPIVFASDPFEDKYFWDARVAVNPVTHQLLATLWTLESRMTNDLDLHIAWGSVDGLQWSSPISTAIHCQTAVPLFLDDMTIVLVYTRRDSGSIEAVISDDGGQTWDIENPLVLYVALASSHECVDIYSSFYGGPDVVRLSTDTVLATFYAGDKTQLNVHSVLITMSDTALVAPEPK
jgi:hypothetical protein